MASLIRRKYLANDKNGKKVKKQSQYWYVDYKDANGIRKRKKAYKDKVASLQLAAQLEREAELESSGVIDKFAKYRKTPLRTHLEDFKKSLINKGGTEKHANMTYQRAKTLIDNCKFAFISDVQASILLNEIAKLYKEKTVIDDNNEKQIERHTLSIQSRNYYLKAVKQFFNWMVEDQRVGENPVAHTKCQNAVVDVRRKRRALSEEEVGKLVSTTLNGSVHHGMTSKHRAMLYLLAVNTGFRASELASLTWGLFDFSKFAPSVTIEAAYSKHRREDVQPLRHDIAKLFEEWGNERGVEGTEKVFKTLKYMRWADMIRTDLEAAGVEYVDDSGCVADFHALRHTYITNVVKGGASPKVAQSLARHSKITLTMDTYMHLGLYDQRAGLDGLPELPCGDGDKKEIAKKTGTNEQPVQVADSLYTPVYTKLAETAYSGCQPSATNDTEVSGKIQDLMSDEGFAKSLEMSHLGAKKKPLSSLDNGGFLNEAEGTRTLNLRIDSPML